MAYWKDVFQETKKLIPLYGTTPNKATFNPEYREKRHKCFYDPTHSYKPVDTHGNVLDFEQFSGWLQRLSRLILCLVHPKNLL